MAYDQTNIFARILRGELPCDTVYEDEHVLAFNDIRPLAPVHVLVIPKGPYTSLDDFTADAGPDVVGHYFKVVGEIARKAGLAGTGYRILSNIGGHGHQEVPHLHVHVLGGRPLGRMLPDARG